MIVVVARIRTNAERRAKLIEAGTALAAASRAEDGCVNYALHQDAEDEDAFVIVEEWESEDALRRHFSQPHMAAFMGAVPDAVIAPPDVQFHTVAGTKSMAEMTQA